MSGYIARELLQGAVETSELFDEYLVILENSQQEGGAGYVTSAVCEVPGGELIGIADEMGVLRLVNLSDNTFRLFVIAQKEGRKPWKEPFSNINSSGSPDASGIASLQGTHIETMAFEQQDGGICVYFTLQHSPLILHTGWAYEPSNLSYEVYLFGRHQRAVSSLKCSDSYVATGDEGGTLSVWNSDDKLMITETKPLYSLESLHNGCVSCICFVTDYIITGSMDNTINVIAASSGHIHRQLLIDSGRVTCISVFGTRDHFSVGNDKGGYVILDPQGEVVHLQSHFTNTDSITSISSPSAGAAAYAVSLSSGSLDFYSKEDFTLVKTFTTKGDSSNPCVYTGTVVLGGVCSTVAVTKNGAVWVLPPAKIFPQMISEEENNEAIQRMSENGDEDNDICHQEEEECQEEQQHYHQQHSPSRCIPTTPSRDQELPNPHLVASPSHDETIWNATLSTQPDHPTPATKGSAPHSHQRDPPHPSPSPSPATTSPSAIAMDDLVFKNRQKAAAMRDLPTTSSTSSMSRPTGDRRAMLLGHLQKMEAEDFDFDEYKKTNPSEYQTQLTRHPAKDPTSYDTSTQRYSNLPSLEVGSTDNNVDPLAVVKQVPKQLSQNWIASKQMKPPTTLPPLLQQDLLRSEWAGNVYDCPVPIPSFALDNVTHPFTEGPPPLFM